MNAPNGSKFLTAYRAFEESRAAARELQSTLATLEAKRKPTEASIAKLIADADAERHRAVEDAKAMSDKLEVEIRATRDAYDATLKQTQARTGGLDELLYAELRNL
jgi:Skp family chaperone for outer membrane proteins